MFHHATIYIRMYETPNRVQVETIAATHAPVQFFKFASPSVFCSGPDLFVQPLLSWVFCTETKAVFNQMQVCMYHFHEVVTVSFFTFT